MNTKDIAFIAAFAAIIAVLGIFPPIPVPLIPVPITAQSLGVMLAGGVLGAKRGALSVLLFLLLVAVGLPLLAGGRGGIGVLVDAWAGYRIGWILAAFVIGLLAEMWWSKLNTIWAFLACAIGGMVVLYPIGALGLATIGDTPFLDALIGNVAFIPGDAFKSIVAAIIIAAIAKSYPIIGRRT